jgi:ribosome biogenesis GTPase
LIGNEEHKAVVSAPLLAAGRLPVTGDWVAVRVADASAVIESIEPRQTRITRRAAGRATEEQVLAANVDTALVVCGLDGDFHPRRVERYLAIVHDGGVAPIVVLNKADVCADVEAACAAIHGVRVLVVSARTGAGFDALHEFLRDGTTAVLLGSSGAGKSSMLNRLLGESRQKIGPVRESDDRGRHTTTHRELVMLPSGAAIIDTPGLREIQLLVDQAAIDAVFSEITALAEKCRFRDCSHEGEPGCAVRGTVSSERLESFHKLGREAAGLTAEQSEKAVKRYGFRAAKRKRQ